MALNSKVGPIIAEIPEIKCLVDLFSKTKILIFFNYKINSIYMNIYNKYIYIFLIILLNRN